MGAVQSSRSNDISAGELVHGFYLGPLPNTRVMNFDPEADHLLWGPEQLRVLAQGPVRPALVKQMLSCPSMAIAHMLDETFLPALDVDEQEVLLESLNKNPRLFQSWATPDRFRLLSLPAKRHAGKLLLPAVATMDAKVREIVLGLAL